MRVLENIAEWTGRGLTVRCWFQRDEFGPTPTQAFTRLSMACDACTPVPGDLLVFAEAVEKQLQKVNALEVKDHRGVGVLIYPDWP